MRVLLLFFDVVVKPKKPRCGKSGQMAGDSVDVDQDSGLIAIGGPGSVRSRRSEAPLTLVSGK